MRETCGASSGSCIKFNETSDYRAGRWTRRARTVDLRMIGDAQGLAGGNFTSLDCDSSNFQHVQTAHNATGAARAR